MSDPRQNLTGRNMANGAVVFPAGSQSEPIATPRRRPTTLDDLERGAPGRTALDDERQQDVSRLFESIDLSDEEGHARAGASLWLARRMSLDPVYVFNRFEEVSELAIRQANATPQRWLESIRNDNIRGRLMTQIAELRVRQMNGDQSPEIEERLAELREQLPPEDSISRGWAHQALGFVAEQAPLWREAAERGAVQGAAGAIGAGSAAAVGGLALNAAPGVGQAAYAASIAGSSLAGFTVGSAVGGFQAIQELEAGMIYDSLMVQLDPKDRGVNPTRAAIAAYAGGTVSAVLEQLQIRSVPGLNRLVGNSMRRAIAKQITGNTLARVVSTGVRAVATETAENAVQETLQEATAIIAEETVREIENQTAGTAFERDGREIAGRLKEAAVSGLAGFSALGLSRALPSMMRQMSRSGRAQATSQLRAMEQSEEQQAFEALGEAEREVWAADEEQAIRDEEIAAINVLNTDPQTGVRRLLDLAPRFERLQERRAEMPDAESSQPWQMTAEEYEASAPASWRASEAAGRWKVQVSERLGVSEDIAEMTLVLAEIDAAQLGVDPETYVQEQYGERIFSTPDQTSKRRENAWVEALMRQQGLSLEEATEAARTRIRGEAELHDNAASIIHLAESADVSTVVHELGHSIRRHLAPDLLVNAERIYGVENGTWSVNAEEAFATDWEAYWRRGIAPSEEHRSLFQRMADILRDIYGVLTDKLMLAPEKQDLFDQIVTRASMRPEDVVAAGAGVPADATGVPLVETEVTQPKTEIEALREQMRERVQATAAQVGAEINAEFGPAEGEGTAQIRTRDLPLERLKLSEEAAQFKEGADPDTGVVEGLEADRYERLGTAPIVVWERLNGDLEIITGRHRADLARRLGEKTIPAHVVREADGFTADDARRFDAESNIRDGQGSIEDFVRFFESNDLDEGAARSRGLLSREPGRKGFAIGRYGAETLKGLYHNGQISASKAAAIASGAPNNENAQRAAINVQRQNNAEALHNLAMFIASKSDGPDASQVDMFGNDDSAMQKMIEMASNAARASNALKSEISVLRKARALTGDKARNILSNVLGEAGANVADEDQREVIERRIKQLEQAQIRFAGWPTDPALAQWVRDGAEGENPAIQAVQESEDEDTSTGSLFQSAPPTESAAFREWFGDSKVVDENGQPLVVYHGSPAGNIEAFDVSGNEVVWRDGNGSRIDLNVRALYFSDSQSVAATYTDGGAGRVYPVYLSLKNPKVLNARGSSWDNFSPFGKIAQALADGHDGVIINRIRDDASGSGDPSIVYVAFEPNQAKSISNQGAWSRDDARILFQETAWHGSPHLFDRFSTEAMGTGEGLQAFGWGLYFSERKEIAEGYAKRLAQPRSAFARLGDQVFYRENDTISDAFDTFMMHAQSLPFEDARDATIRDINEALGIASSPEKAMEYMDALAIFQNPALWKATSLPESLVPASDMSARGAAAQQIAKSIADYSEKYPPSEYSQTKELQAGLQKVMAYIASRGLSQNRRKLMVIDAVGKLEQDHRRRVAKIAEDTELSQQDRSREYDRISEALEILKEIHRAVSADEINLGEELAAREAKRALYRVVIDPERESKWLEWFEPISVEDLGNLFPERSRAIAEYSQLTAEIIEAELADSAILDTPEWNDMVARAREMRSSDPGLVSVVSLVGANGQEIYAHLTRTKGSAQKASNYLSERGYTGIKYPVLGTQTTTYEKGVNYVVFNDAAVQLEDKKLFQLAGATAASLTDTQTAWLEQAKARIERGENAADVRSLTGWWRSERTGKWMTEIPDDQIKIKVNMDKAGGAWNGPLAKFITAKNLFETYPILENLQIRARMALEAPAKAILETDAWMFGEADPAFDIESGAMQVYVQAGNSDDLIRLIKAQTRGVVGRLEGFSAADVRGTQKPEQATLFQEDDRLWENVDEKHILTAYGSREEAVRAFRSVDLDLEALSVHSSAGDDSRSRSLSSQPPGESAIRQSWKYNRRVDLTGHTVESHQELAELFTVYRNRRVEQFHIVYLDDSGKILAHNALSSGLPNAALAFESGRASGKSFFAKQEHLIASRAKRLGAARIAVLHNHPSGNPDPSNPDITVTKSLAKMFNRVGLGFFGHVIIDHDSYSVIDGWGKPTRHPFSDNSVVDKPEVLSEGITSHHGIAELAREVLNNDRNTVLVVLNNQYQAIAWYPLQKQWSASSIRQTVQRDGGVTAVIATTSSDEYQAYDEKLGSAEKRDQTVLDIIQVSSGGFAQESSRQGGGLSSTETSWTASANVGQKTRNPFLFQEDLAAFHGITTGKLAQALELGGMPMPSIAVRPASMGYTDFGDVTLIGDRKMVDPELGNDTYSADAYTPRFPDIEWKPKSGPLFDLFRRLNEIEKEVPKNQNGSNAAYIADFDHYAHDPDRLRSHLKGHAGMQILWLREEKGVAYNLPLETHRRSTLTPAERLALKHEYRQEWQDDINTALMADDKERLAAVGDFEDWLVSEKGIDITFETVGEFDLYAHRDWFQQYSVEYDSWLYEFITGHFESPRIKVGRRKVPMTLESVVEAMSRGRAVGGEDVGFFYTTNAARAETSRKFSSIEEMREAAGDRIRPGEQGKEIWKTVVEPAVEEYLSIARRQYKYNADGIMSDFMPQAHKALGMYLRGGFKKRSEKRMATNLRRFDIEPSAEVVESALDAAHAIADAPVKYFESKTPRAVRMEEWGAAVVPATMSEDMKDALRGFGIALYEYGDADDRSAVLARAIEDQPALLFQQDRKRHVDIVEQAVAQYQPVPDGVLEGYSAEPWAIEEIERRRELAEEAREWDDEDEFVAYVAGGEPGLPEAYVRGRYQARIALSDAERSRRWLATLSSDELTIYLLDAVGKDEVGEFDNKVLEAGAEKLRAGEELTESDVSKIRAEIGRDPNRYRRLFTGFDAEIGAVPDDSTERSAEEISGERQTIAEMRSENAELDETLEDLERKATNSRNNHRNARRRVEKLLGEIRDLKESLQTTQRSAREESELLNRTTKATLDDAIKSAKDEARRSELAQKQRLLAEQKELVASAKAETRAIYQYREKVQRQVRRIMAKPAASIDYQFAKQIIEIQRGLRSGQSSFLNRHRERLQNIMNELPQGEVRRILDEELGRVDLKRLPPHKLDELDAQIEELRREGRAVRTQKLALERIERATRVRAIIDSVTSGKGLEELKQVSSKETRKDLKKGRIPRALLNTLRPERLWRIMDGGTPGALYQALWTEINATTDAELRAIDDRISAGEAKMKELGIKPSRLGEIVNVDGYSHTIDEAVHMYIAMQDELSAAALEHGNKIPRETIRKYIAELSPQEKRWGDWMIDSFGHDNFERIQEVLIDVENRGMEKVQRYFPMLRRDFTFADWKDEVADSILRKTWAGKASVNKKFTLERQRIADRNQRAIALGATGIWRDQVAKQEKYIANAKQVRQLRNVFAARELRQAIAQEFGQPAVEMIEKYINDWTNPNLYRATGDFAKMMQVFRNHYSVAVLSYNAITMLKQVPSSILYLAEVGPVHYMAAWGKFLASRGELVREVEALDPQVKARSMNRYMEELKQLDRSGYERIVRKVGDVGFRGIGAMDKIAVVVGWKAVFDSKVQAGYSRDEAVIAAQTATLKTQPAARAKDVAAIYRTDSGLTWFLMFSNQLNQIYNMLAGDLPLAIRNKQASTVFGIIAGITLNAVAMGVISRKRLWDDDQEPEERAAQAGNDLLRQIIAATPVFGSGLTSGIDGWRGASGVNPFPFAYEAGALARALNNGELDISDVQQAIRLLEAAGTAAGLPTVAARRLRKTVLDDDFDWQFDVWELIGGAPEEDN